MVTDGVHVADEEPGVATADVEPVVVQSTWKLAIASSSRLRHFFCTDAAQRRVAELLVVGLPLPEGMMSQLEVRSQLAVQEQRRPDPRAERDDELEPGAAHDVQALQVGVVGDADRVAEALAASAAARSNPVHAAQQLGDDCVAPGHPIWSRSAAPSARRPFGRRPGSRPRRDRSRASGATRLTRASTSTSGGQGYGRGDPDTVGDELAGRIEHRGL